jgi:hypothetical protein
MAQKQARPKDLRTSTSYSRARYAHPFYLPASPGDRQPLNGDTRMTQWSKKQLGPVPKITGDGVMDLSEIIGSDGVDEIEKLGEIRFHSLGDSGVNHAAPSGPISAPKPPPCPNRLPVAASSARP